MKTKYRFEQHMIRRYITLMAPGFFLVAIFASILVGCDSRPATYPVRGTVTYQGKPVPLGSISFVPEKGHMAGGTIAEDGTYRLEAEAGPYKVTITAVPPLPPDVNPMTDRFVPPKPLIPARYSRLGQSGLTAEVQADGENQIDFALR